MSGDIAKDRADWLLDAVACATQDRRFLRGDPEYDAVTGEAILLNGEKAIELAIEQLRSGHTDPISMLLYCPQCGLQHIDEPDERTPDWTNPPHRSHLCHECGCIWRPADVPTEGVASIETVGKADTWTPDKSTARAALLDEAVVERCREYAGRADDCGRLARDVLAALIEAPRTDGLAGRVRYHVAEGDGHWRTCSGCYETCDGQNVHGYPHSDIFGCTQGSGCGECGGLGVIWDTTDLAKARGSENGRS